MEEKSEELETAPLKEGLEVLELASEKVVGFEDKKSLVGSDIASGIVQTLILVLSKRIPKTCKKLCTILVEDVLKPSEEDEEEVDQEKEEKADQDATEEPKVPAMFEFEPVCRTVETVLSLRSQMPEISKKLYEVSKSFKIININIRIYDTTTNVWIPKLYETAT